MADIKPGDEDRESDAYTPSDREPLPSGLIPAERLALTVARAQLERGDNPPVNITTVLVMTIDRLTGGPGQCIKINEPKPYTFTRDELIEALTRLEMHVATSGPIAGKVLADSMADAIIEALAAKPDRVHYRWPVACGDFTSGDLWTGNLDRVTCAACLIVTTGKAEP